MKKPNTHSLEVRELELRIVFDRGHEHLEAGHSVHS